MVEIAVQQAVKVHIAGEEKVIPQAWKLGESVKQWVEKGIRPCCPTCHYFVGQDEAINVVRWVDKNKGNRFWIPPETPKGLCFKPTKHAPTILVIYPFR